MPSTIDLANLAISRVGGNRINNVISLGDSNAIEAQQCSIKLPTLIQTALRRAEWNFATKTRPLAFLGEGNSIYNFRYNYPSDCLLLISVQNSLNIEIPYSVERGDENTRNILCDEEQALIKYVEEISDPNQWDSLFYDYVAWQLAAELALTLSGSGTKAELLYNMAEQAFQNALLQNAREFQPKELKSRYIKARSF